MKVFSVTQNTSFLTAASILQKVISFVYFTIIARMIGVENTGAYFFAITFTTIFTVVADFGMGPVLTREVSRYPDKSEQYLHTAFWAKVMFGLLSYALVVFFVNVLNYPYLIRVLVSVSGVTMFFDNLHAAFYSIFRARKNLIYESIGIVGSQAITLIIGTVALFNHWPLYWLILAYTIPAFLNFIFSAFCLKKIYGLIYRFSFNFHIFKMFLGFALPFAMAGIIGRLYSYSDSLLMSKMLSAQELGWWSVPYKISFAFQFVPVALSASVYPVMSELYLTQKEKIGDLFLKSWRYLFTIVFPISFGLIALATPVILKLYKPQFAPAIPVLRILLISLIFGYLSFITGATLNASNKQKTQTILLGFALFINIIMNLILLPRIGIMGAAFAALLSNIILSVGGFWFCRHLVSIDLRVLFKYFNQTFWPAILMASLAFYLSTKISFLIIIPICAVLYGLLLFIFGGIDKIMLLKFYNKIIDSRKVV
ncbi:MAG: flippase [Candidatus Magasanikbacteria bacterium]